MLSTFRNLSKSKVGTLAMAVVLVGILAGFALADIQSFGTGDVGFGSSSGTVAKVGDERISEADLSEALQRRLQEVRQQDPQATYASISGDVPVLLGALIDQRALIAFANKYGFHPSKRLIDAEIAQLPDTRGLNGQFSEDAYRQFLAQRQLTDQQVRLLITGGMLERMLISPVAANARIATGIATPYASMLLESRTGQGAAIPAEAFARSINPSDAQIAQYYQANLRRYMVPEQRQVRIAVIGPDAVAAIRANEQEISEFYKANPAAYAAKNVRTLTQAVVADRASATAIADRAKRGASLADAARPAGDSVALSTIEDQTKSDYAALAGARAADAAFAAGQGKVIGPIQTDFGWVVVRVDKVTSRPGKSLDAARSEIAERLTQDKQRAALEELVATVEDSIAGGANFGEAASEAKLAVIETPLVTAQGRSLGESRYVVPANLLPAIKAGFELAANDDPEIVSLGEDGTYAMVAPANIVPTAPRRLAEIRPLVRSDYIAGESDKRAKAAAERIAAKVSSGTSLEQAVREAGVPLPSPRPLAARRIQIANAEGQIPAPMQMLFTLPEGKSRMVRDDQGRGYYVVRTDKIVPGNALLQPGIIARMQGELQEGKSDEYAREFLAAIKADVGVSTNQKAVDSLLIRLRQNNN